jgi:DNA-binding GntR family transcriptional regulator
LVNTEAIVSVHRSHSALVDAVVAGDPETTGRLLSDELHSVLALLAAA